MVDSRRYLGAGRDALIPEVSRLLSLFGRAELGSARYLNYRSKVPRGWAIDR